MEAGSAETKATILIAEDDYDDRMLLEMAFQAFENTCQIKFVLDGEQLMEYLNRQSAYSDPDSSPRPDLILLDLNMPKKSGHQALQEIKRAAELKDIPVVIWTTSASEKDMAICRKIGADDFLTKPSSFAEVVKTMAMLSNLYSKRTQILGPASC